MYININFWEKVIFRKNKLSDFDIKNHFPKIHEGINKLTHWINN